MITTDDKEKAILLRQLRNQGQDYRYHHIHLGYNYRMTNIPAAIGMEQLKRIEFILSEKETIVERYNKALKDDPDISPPYLPEYVDRHSWYMYAISLRDGLDRDKVVSELEARGIDTRLSFPPIHIQPFYQKKLGYKDDSLPISYKAWKQLIDLPIWAGLTVDDQDYVIENLKEIVKNQGQ
jgi:perosamine synthetase